MGDGGLVVGPGVRLGVGLAGAGDDGPGVTLLRHPAITNSKAISQAVAVSMVENFTVVNLLQPKGSPIA